MRTIRLRPWFRWFLPRLLLSLGIYCGGYTIVNLALSASLAAELDAIRERGEPAVAEELTHPDVAPERDAGPYYRGACALMEGLGESGVDALGGFGMQVNPVEDGDPSVEVFGWVDDEGNARSVVEVDAWLREQPALETLLAEVRRRPECKSNVAFDEEGPFTLLPHLMPSKRLTEFALASSSASAARGDLQRAVDLHVSGYALASCTASDRFCLISALVAASIEGLVSDHLQLLLSSGTLGEGELAQIDAALASTPRMEQVYREALLGERAGLGSFIFQAMLEGRTVSYLGDLPAATGLVRLELLADFKVYLERLEEGIRTPWEAPLAESLEYNTVPRYALITRALLPALNKFRARMQQVEVERQLGRCALSLERERLRTGSAPATLPAKYAEAGIRYSLTDSGFELSAADPARYSETPLSFRVRR